MRFADVKSITIPEGDVVSITAGGVKIWDKPNAEQYTFPEYIQLNSDLAFNTGAICNQDTTIEMTFTREDSSARYLFGVASSGNTASLTGYQSGVNSGSWRFGAKYGRPSVATNTKLTFTMDKTGIVMNGTKSSYSGVSAFETPHPLAVGGCMSASGSIGATRHIGKIYGFRLWQGDVLTIDWIPCVKSDGEQGLWDNISQKFISSV